MKLGVSYIRVSTDHQGESKLGLEAQQLAVHQYASANGIQLIHEFTEIESGKKNKRPVLEQALALCRKYKALLIIAKLDRLGRNVAFISALMENNVKFVAVDNPNANELILHIMAAFAQYERQQISIRTKEALAAAKRRGVKLGEHGKILSKKNRYRAELFAGHMWPVIERLKTEGFTSVRKITMELNRQKIPSFRNGTKWHRTSVHNLLKRLAKLKEAKPMQEQNSFSQDLITKYRNYFLEIVLKYFKPGPRIDFRAAPYSDGVILELKLNLEKITGGRIFMAAGPVPCARDTSSIIDAAKELNLNLLDFLAEEHKNAFINAIEQSRPYFTGTTMFYDEDHYKIYFIKEKKKALWTKEAAEEDIQRLVKDIPSLPS